jgi:alpha-mannosidase
MRVPAGLEENGGDPWRRLDGAGNNAKRVEETVPLRIRSDVTLRKGSPYLEVVTRFDNRARNHRLRAVFPTRLPKASHCAAESAFDVVEREIAHSPSSPWYGSKATFPMQRFVDVSDGRCGLALLNDGLREYEITQDEDRAIAVTLLRAFEVNLSTVSYRWETRPEMNLAQSPGEHEFRYALFPHSGDWNVGGVCREAEAFTNALIPAQVGPHDGYLPTKRGFLEIEPNNLVLSAFKRSEDGKGWIVRFYNPTTRPVQARLKVFRKIVSASLVNLEEKEIRQLRPSGSSVALEAAPKKIVTVKLVQ